MNRPVRHSPAPLLLAVLLLAAPAGATVLDTWTQFSVQFSNLGRAAASDSGVGVTTVTSTSASNHLQSLTAGLVPGAALSSVLPVTDPLVSIGGIVEARLTAARPRPDLQGGVFGNISGAVASTAGGLTPATAPVTGMLRICLVFTGCSGPTIDVDLGGTTSMGGLIGVGVGGVLTIGGTGTIMISFVVAPYSVKTVTLFNRTQNQDITTFMEHGFAHGPGSATSSTGQTSGVLQIISPNHSFSTGIPGNGDLSGNFNRMLVHFVPEPGLLLLLGSGALGLALLGRSRLR